MRSLGPTDLKRLHRDWRRRTTGRVGLVLDGVMTPVNVGSICRLAAAYGIERMWCAGATPSVRHPGAQKTAMGTDRFLDIVTDVTSADAIGEARGDGYQIVGLELADGAVPMHASAFEPDVCLVVGHEEHGLAAASLASCDIVTYLPLVGRVGSLNVATAAGIALYELRRREWSNKEEDP